MHESHAHAQVDADVYVLTFLLIDRDRHLYGDLYHLSYTHVQEEGFNRRHRQQQHEMQRSSGTNSLFVC